LKRSAIELFQTCNFINNERKGWLNDKSSVS